MQERIDKYRNVFEQLTGDQPTDYVDSHCPELLGGFTIEADNSSLSQESQEDDLDDLECKYHQMQLMEKTSSLSRLLRLKLNKCQYLRDIGRVRQWQNYHRLQGYSKMLTKTISS